MENLTIGFMSDNGFKFITLSLSIFAESKSAEGSVEAILSTLKRQQIGAALVQQNYGNVS
jgi:hypothetical protein